MTTPKAASIVLALIGAIPFAVSAAPTLDGSVLGPSDAQPDLMRRGYSPSSDRRYQEQARQGPLISLGFGGGSLYLSNEGPTRVGAGDVDFRLGYGFTDRFQMFMDLNADIGRAYNGNSVGSWTWTLRGQTVLVGDRAGNGLNLNFGAGLGGLTYDTSSSRSSSTGFALAGGISYDARITPWFALSPEFFVTWHQIPNQPGIPDDVSSMYGVRLNLLWYLH